MTLNFLRYQLIILMMLGINFTQAQQITEQWEDGTIKLQGQLLNGERHGFWQKWHPNGKIEYEGTYIEGNSDGIWKYYCKHGYIEKIVKWKDGKCFEIVDYFLSGIPNVYINFENGLNVHEYLEYHKIEEWCKGNQYRITNKRINNSVEDSLIHYAFSPIIFQPNSRLEAMQLRERYRYHKDSIVVIEILKNNYLVQFCKSLGQKFEYIEYFYAGTGDTLNMNRTVKLFEDSVLLDLKIEYYEMEPFGPYEEVLYLDDELISKVSYEIYTPKDHLCKQYHKNGQIESVISIKEDLKHGNVKRYSNTGKLIFKGKYKEGKLIKSKTY